MQVKVFLQAVLIGTALTAVSCWGGAIVNPPDASCNPTVDTPVSGGCTWYNFYLNTTVPLVADGSSFTNYYTNAGSTPAWTITTTGYTDLLFLDGGHQGDTFEVLDNGTELGLTSSTSIDGSHVCGGSGSGTDPAVCWNDSLMSRGSWLLAPGSHSITVVWEQMVPGGSSTLQWFEIGDTTATPEPVSMFLVGSGLIALAAIRRFRRP